MKLPQSKSRLRKTRTGRIEIIPMIDVMFFLLATFVISSISMQHLSGIKVDLTQGKADKIQNEKTINLTITKDNLIFVDQEKISLNLLTAKLKPILQKNDKSVIIISDKEASQGAVMQAMLAARTAGAVHFSMVVKE